MSLGTKMGPFSEEGNSQGVYILFNFLDSVD